MKPSERSIAFFAALLLTFGITGLNFEYPAFEHNSLEYVMLGLGIILAVIFLIGRLKAR